MNYQTNYTLHNYKININYPNDKYYRLNEEICKIINEYRFDFINSLRDYNIQSNIIYELNMSYEKYEYKNYISYVYNVEEYTGGAHPNHYIFTVIYDKELNKIISIVDLINVNKNILNRLSILSRNELLSNYAININDNNLKDMFYNGTNPIITNFKNIAFTNEGILIIFERYSIAPYYMGEFKIIIPYDKILD